MDEEEKLGTSSTIKERLISAVLMARDICTYCSIGHNQETMIAVLAVKIYDEIAAGKK